MINFKNKWQRISALVKKEVKTELVSPSFYVFFGMFSLITGWLFFTYLQNAKNLTQSGLLDSIYYPLMGNINFVFLFLTPIITMKSFSDEKRNGTLSVLYTSKLSVSEIIIAKFLSAQLIVMLIFSIVWIYPFVLSFSGFNEWPLFFTGMFAVFLCTSCYTAAGLFFSSVTESAIISALMGLGLSLFLMLLIFSAQTTTNFLVSDILKYLSIATHFERLMKGVISTESLSYFFSFVIVFYYLTVKSLNSKDYL